MSFDLYDNDSQVDQQELYLFTSTDIENTQLVYGFTTGPTEVTFDPTHLPVGPIVFEPEAIARGRVPVAVSGSNAQTTVTFNPNNEFAKKLALGEFYNTFSISMIKISPSGDSVVRFQGFVTQAIYSPTSIKLNCTNILDKSSSKLRAHTISRVCPWSVYSAKCGSKGTDYSLFFNVSILGIDTARGIISVEVPVIIFDPKDMIGGLVVMDSPIGTPILSQPRSYIQASVIVGGGTHVDLTLNDSRFVKFLFDKSATTIFMLKGCNKTTATCDGLFKNSENFGGFPAIPREIAVRS